MTTPSDPSVSLAQCKGCGADFRLGEPFCGKCGQQVSCMSCGQAFQDGERFCPSCGRAKTSGFVSSGGDAGGAASVWDLVQAKLRRGTLGEFEILGEVGRGGMAAVYLAHEVALNRKVAIKVMSPALIMGHGMDERFRQEAITVANLNHQNIITLHAVRQFEDLQYFVMQYVDGCSLETIVKESGPLSIPIVRALLYHVGSALAHAHHQGVIHRDVKPGNILTNRRGQALVTDFGIAKVMESPSNTQTGTVVGTPSYMSPEQCRTGEVTWRSDQYSLGIVAYEMVAGKVPFDGPTLAVLNAQVHEPVPRLTDVRPDCPEDLADAIGRMLEKKPEDRFDDMSVALGDLGALPLFPGDPTYQNIAKLVETHHVQASVPTTPVSPIMRRTPDGVTVVSGQSKLAAETTPIPTPVPAVLGPDDVTEGMTTSGVRSSVTMVSGSAQRRRSKWGVAFAMFGIAGAALGVWLLGQWATAAPAVPAPAPIDPVVSVAIPIDLSTIDIGESVSLTATVTDTGGAILEDRTLTWRSTDLSVARVDSKGLVEAAGVGTAYIMVNTGTHRDSTRVIVSAPAPAPPRNGGGPAAVASVSVDPAELSLEVGGTRKLAPNARDASGKALTGRSVRWASADRSIARVSGNGTVSAIAAGTTAIRVTIGGKTRTVPVTVSQEPPTATSLRVLTEVPILENGASVSVSAVLYDQRGNPMDVPVTWSSSNPGFVHVGNDGVARARATGSAWLVATAAGKSDSVLATVAVPAERQFELAVAGFLRAMDGNDLASIRSLFQPSDDAQQKRIAKLVDKVKNGSWDLEADTEPSGMTSRMNGDRAIVDFSAELRWKNAFGGRKKEKVTFIATFVLDGAVWRLTRVQTAAGTKL